MESVGLASTPVVPQDEEEIDPWGGEDDDVELTPSTQSMDLEREWEARRLQFHNLGYRDGITAGNNSSVQEGFNVGFHEAVGPGFSWGVARGAASAYSALPSSLKELLLKDRETRKRLEALDSTISNISSADAMGIYYKDTVLQKGGTTEHSLEEHSREGSGMISSAETRIEEDKRTKLGDTSNACCGGGSCGDSRACSSQVLDGISTIGIQSKLDGFNPPSASTHAVEESFANEHVSEEAYKFILRVGTSSDDTKQLEDSTTSHLVSMALGQPGPSASAPRDSESCTRLEQYQRDVSAQVEPSAVKLSSFPEPSQASEHNLVI